MSSSYPPRQAVQTLAPAAEPVTLAEAKLFLRVDSDAEDSLINQFITAARQQAEQYLGKVLITQNWQMKQVYVPGQAIPIGPAPLQSITTVKTLYHGSETTLTTDDYEVEVPNDRIRLVNRPTADHVVIDFTAGYGDAEDVPAAIKQAVLHAVSALYHYREHNDGLSPEAAALLEDFAEIRL